MPYKNKEKQKQATKKAMQKRRALQKLEKEEKEAETLIPKPLSKKYPISWIDYKNHFPNSRFSDYLEEKTKFEKENRGEILSPEIEQILERNLYPLQSFDCKKFRLEVAGLIDKTAFFAANHHVSCESCIKWYHKWKDYAKGANPWQ